MLGPLRRSLAEIATLLRSLVRRHPGISVLLAAAFGAHVAVIVSIAGQPLEPSRYSTARAWIWPLHNDTVHRRGPGADFFALYEAGRSVRRGHSAYDREPMPEAPHAYAYRYLPALASGVGAPLSRLAPKHAWWLWIALLEVLLATTIAQIALLSRRRVAVWASVLLLLSSPYFLELHMGQFTFASCALAVLAAIWTEFRGGRTSAAAAIAAFASAALLKVFPLVTLPAFARTARGAAVGALAAVAVGAVALPGFALHPDDWETFRRINFSAPVGGLDAGNYGLSYVAHLLLAPEGGWAEESWQRLVLVWQWGLLFSTAGLVVMARHPGLLLGAATLLLAHFLSYVHVWEHHMSGALVAVLAAALVAEREGERGALAVLLACGTLLALPTPFWLLDSALDPRVWDPSTGWPSWQRALLASSKALPLLLAFGACLWVLLRQGVGAPRLLSGSQPDWAASPPAALPRRD